MEILKSFGIEPILLLAQIVNFLIILFILKKILYKPVLTLLKTREEKIERGLKDADQARKLLEETSEKEKEILKNAQKEANKLLADTKKQLDSMTKASQDSSKKQAEQILKQAKQQISQESADAEARITKKVTAIAIQLLEKSLSQLVNEETQQEIMVKAIKQLEKKPN